ncbi:hypothetical protein K0040_04645 [Terrisporobacter petrolearius]|uniref:hypothetical protein n=1 Tax=Terrisporobacter petrolearius TaxID=1460447 RepID=UPI001D166497|nr:hypothetical protein [Terrisporobacter petrolearius]MCC3863598.1 hypothetical protein [Terrisporobacter petrolearius]
MPFIDKTSILVESSINKGLTLFEFGKNIVSTRIDPDLNNIDSRILFNGEYSFIDIWLDVDDKDNIYGILNDKKGKLKNLIITSDDVDLNTIIKYDYKNFFIKFTYIKKISDENHILYYSINKNFPYCAYIIHLYKSPNICKKTRIDFINYSILTNFVITYSNNIPTIFYFKLVNHHEELFSSTFDKNLYTWSSPKQITNSKKDKIYLSAIKDNKNNYHIVFAENNKNRYYCKYIQGNFIEDNFNITSEKYISKNSMCVFPNLISTYSKIYIQWIEYFDLYTSESLDFGKSWSDPKLNYSASDFPFQRYEFRSNNNIYNTSTIYALKNHSIIL